MESGQSFGSFFFTQTSRPTTKFEKYKNMDDIIILRFFRFVKSKYTKTYKKYCGNCNWPCGTGTGLR